MNPTKISDDVRSRLCSFYRDQGVGFWQVFEETPRAAVAAFKSNPEIFGALDPHYVRWFKSRSRQHARLSDLLDQMVEAMPSLV